MLDEFITIRRGFATLAGWMPDEALKVYLFLVERNEQQKHQKLGLSVTELARATNLSVSMTMRGLQWLTKPEFQQFFDGNMEAHNGFIAVQPKGKHFIITLNTYWIGEERATPIPFSLDAKDEEKIAKVEEEMRRVVREQQRLGKGYNSGLGEHTRGDERDVLMEIERDIGRGLTPFEAFQMGKAIGSYFPSRVKQVWRKTAIGAKNPIPALVQILNKGGAGQAAPKKEWVDTGVKLQEF